MKKLLQLFRDKNKLDYIEVQEEILLTRGIFRIKLIYNQDIF